jgi:hypothetical protein
MSKTIPTSSYNFKSQLFDLASDIQDVSKRNKWIASYDTEADSLSITERHLPSDISIKYLNNEIAVFVTPKADIKGIFIEYFTKNFLRHTDDLSDLKQELREKRTGNLADEALIQVKKQELTELLNNLQADFHELVLHKMSGISAR